jgi:serine protease Do
MVLAVFWLGRFESVRAKDESSFNRRTPVVKVYQQAHKAVVNISGQRVVSTSIWPGFDWPDMFDPWGPRVQRQLKVLGSGVVAHEDGYIITNAHVIENAKKIQVTFSDGSEYAAEVISADKSKDLALLQVKNDKKLPFIHLGRSNDLMIGETVIAIGNPYGYANTVTSGVLSAMGRDIQVTEDYWLRGLLQTDAPINPGNSGGPLLNINGELIGINTAIRAEAQNIGFAIPVDTLVNNLTHMLMPESLRRVRFGLVMGRRKTLGELTGLVVESVNEASPAAEKGISAGDVVLEIDGHKLVSVIDFYVRMIDKKIGQPVQIRYVRPEGAQPKVRTIELTLAPRPLPDGRLLAKKFFQMEVSELTERVARRFDFEGAYPVLIITDVQKSGVAGETGLEGGDLILEVNGQAVRNLREFSLEMEKVKDGDVVKFTLMRIIVRGFAQFRRQFTVPLKADAEKSRQYRL